MIQIVRTNSSNAGFRELIALLDQKLASINGEAHDFFDQHNQIDLQHVIVATDGENPVGCGAFKEFERGTVEIKRMFVKEAFRGQGIAKKVLFELELWAKEAGYEKCVLETSIELESAVGLYQKEGYREIPKYEPYTHVETSICMAKNIG